ncbi:MAG: hypothetical protein KJ941_03935 [Bacteroidetes bacterium]|nr:hypothetical protein [Bacteroidota bacterium]
MQNITDDDVYIIKSSELPIGDAVSDETSYEAYKYRNNIKSNNTGYYNPENNRPILNQTFPRTILFTNVFYSNQFYNGSNINNGNWNSHSNTFYKPRGGINGSSTQNLTKYQYNEKVFAPLMKPSIAPMGIVEKQNMSVVKPIRPNTGTPIQYEHPKGSLKPNNLPGRNSGNLNVPSNSSPHKVKSPSMNSGSPKPSSSTPIGRRKL